jgi:hypothetical protein
MSKIDQATKIQQHIDWEYNIDIAAFQTSELKRLVNDINSFLELDVETEDLDEADNFVEEQEYSDEDQEHDEFTNDDYDLEDH